MIGINDYPKFPADKQLTDSVNDVNAIDAVLLGEQFRFPRANVEKLINHEATCDAILTMFRSHLVNNINIRQGNLVVVYYSGHRLSITDMHADEESGYNQTIVPYEASRYSTEKVFDISDDELTVLLDERRSLGQFNR